MELSKTKLTLIVIASIIVGMAIVIVGAAAWLYMQVQSDVPASFSIGGRKEKTVSAAPEFSEANRYLGSHGSSFGENLEPDNTILAAGDSAISGKAVLKNTPLAGLKVRLRLNGKVLSQWGTSDANGVYSVSVPAGRYTVTGYELDSQNANKILGGMITHPRQHGQFATTTSMDVKPSKSGTGLDFEFTDPVIVLGPIGEIPADSKLIVTWKAYPGAASYRVQLEEREKPRQYGTIKHLFSWSSRPVVTTTSFDLSTTDAKLKPGYHYRIKIEALDKNGEPISENADDYRMPGFNVAVK